MCPNVRTSRGKWHMKFTGCVLYICLPSVVVYFYVAYRNATGTGSHTNKHVFRFLFDNQTIDWLVCPTDAHHFVLINYLQRRDKGILLFKCLHFCCATYNFNWSFVLLMALHRGLLFGSTTAWYTFGEILSLHKKIFGNIWIFIFHFPPLLACRGCWP